MIIDGSEPPYIFHSVVWGSLDISFGTYRTPFQIGETPDSVVVKSRKPVFDGYVISSNTDGGVGETISGYYEKQENSIEENKIHLEKVINIYHDLLIEVNGYKIKCRPTGPVKYSEEEKENNEIMCLFTFEVACYDPRFYTGEKVYSLVSVENMFHFPFHIPNEGVIFGVKNANNILHVRNNGDTEVGMRIELSAVRGSVKNISVTKAGSGEKLELLDYDLAQGNRMTIETEVGKENITVINSSTGDVESVLHKIKYDSDFIRAEIGESIIVFSAGEGTISNAEIFVYLTERYFNFRGM